MHIEPVKTMQPSVLSWSHMDRCGLPYNIIFLNCYTTPTMRGTVSICSTVLHNGGNLTSEPRLVLIQLDTLFTL